jgi:hypothetical protein
VTLQANHHATLSEPPFQFEMDNGGEKHLMQPNMAYGIAAQAGCELQDYLESGISDVADEKTVDFPEFPRLQLGFRPVGSP